MYTRDYRSGTYWIRAATRFVSRFTFAPLESLGVNMGLIKSRQKTLVWTKESKAGSEQVQLPDGQVSEARHVTSPSFALTDYSTAPHDECAMDDSPAMAHSLFPLALTPHRPRTASDTSIHEPVLPIFQRFRRSDDSSRPLVTAPPDIHRWRASSTHHNRRVTEETDLRSSSEHALSPSSPLGEASAHGGRLEVNTRTLQSRQGYRRRNSDPGSPPHDVAITGAYGSSMRWGLASRAGTLRTCDHRR
jgi:hypothetical protein